MEHEHQRRRVEPRIVDRQRFELAAAQLDVVERLQPLARRLEHRRRGVHRDHVLHERRERRAGLAGAAAQIAQHPVGFGQRREGAQVKALPVQFIAQPIPLAGRRREEFLRLRAPVGERGLEAALILRGRRRRPDLIADERPQAPRPAVELLRASSCRGGSCRPPAPTPSRCRPGPSRCRLTVDCGSCMMPHSSDTVSSCRSSSSSSRLLVVSASEARWSRMAGARVLICYIRQSGCKD